MLRMERVEVGIILRKGVGLYQSERLSGLGGGGARATQPGAGRPASPWVATTDPTLRAKAAAARPGQVRQGRVALERSPPPRCQRPRWHYAPEPQVARGAGRGGAAICTPKTSCPAGRGAAWSSRAEWGSRSQFLPRTWARPRSGSQVRRTGGEE